MNASTFSAQCKERRASNASAGCSNAPTEQPLSGRGQSGLFASRSSQQQSRRNKFIQSFCFIARLNSLSCTAATLQDPGVEIQSHPNFFANRPAFNAKKRRRRGRCRGILQEPDYAIYQTLPVEQINEDFLWKRLQPLLEYLDAESIEKVKEALSFALSVHAGQMRKSGEPYITHPLEVARILAALRMDMDSLIAGLLHDTVEDNPHVASFEEIEMVFGPAVRTIVEGETKFSKIGELSSETGSKGDVKARDLQHLFLAMTKEVRIIVVKLADRLHNMRTLGSMPPHKQRKIAEETLQVFAPLARLLGLYSIKEELEELAFGYSMPEEYTPLRLHLEQIAKEQSPVVQQAKQVLEDLLNSDAFLQQRAEPVEIRVMQKSAYSVYRKLERCGGSLSDVTDVAQLCVVIPRKESLDPILYGTGTQLCYHVMGLVHNKWPPIPGSIKDYIATPKRNGYQSLHTTVLPLGSTTLFPLELHIRTSRMQKLAEFGIAGEKWVAKREPSLRAAVLPDSPSLDAQIQQALQRRPTRTWLSPDLMAGVFKSLPRMLGLSFMGLTASAVNGAALSIKGTALTAEQQAQLNATAKRSLGSAFAARDIFHANANAVEANGIPVNGVASCQSGVSRLSKDIMKRREHWLKSIIEWQNEFLGSLTAQEFVDGITGDLLGRGVFVFTPRGEILRLPKDSTTVDFAYHVHTDVGNQMVGAKVNGKLVDPDHILCNAEVVEVLTYDGQPTALSVSRHYVKPATPLFTFSNSVLVYASTDSKDFPMKSLMDLEWARFTKSRTARHKLAKFLKEHGHLLPDHYRPPVSAEVLAGDLSNGQTRASDDCSTSSGSSNTKESNETVWLDVEGDDGPGSLAKLAQIIDRHGHNVKTYSRRMNSSGTLHMRFEVQGREGHFSEMCAEIGAASCVRSWKIAT